jgi:acetolactate synthase-1/3 small subunit
MKMLNTISSIFTRRNINIESMVTSEIIEEDIIGYTIVVYENINVVKRVMNKLEKQVKLK